MSTKQHPGPRDCYAAALPDEPYFVLLARDPSAPDLIEQWAEWRDGSIVAGARPSDEKAQVDEAYRCASEMRTWRRLNLGVWRRPAGSDAPRGVIIVAKQAREYLTSELKRHAPHLTPVADLLGICGQVAGFITALVNQNRALAESRAAQNQMLGEMDRKIRHLESQVSASSPLSATAGGRRSAMINAQVRTHDLGSEAFAFENQFTSAGASAPETPERTTPKVSATVGAPPRPNLSPGPWIHYKFNTVFELLNVALNEGTGEWMVVHMNRHSRNIFVRPVGEWEQIVVTNDGRRVPRFRAPERKDRKNV
jgi:hypothetical protein